MSLKRPFVPKSDCYRFSLFYQQIKLLLFVMKWLFKYQDLQKNDLKLDTYYFYPLDVVGGASSLFLYPG